MSDRQLTWEQLANLPEDQQAAYWDALVARWQRNAEQEIGTDFAFDARPERRCWHD
jgi:hypothetical protein